MRIVNIQGDKLLISLFCYTMEDKIYEMVTTNRKQKLTDNSCAFSILEQGYREYIENVLRKKPPGPPIPEKLWLTRFRDWSSIFFAQVHS